MVQQQKCIEELRAANKEQGITHRAERSKFQEEKEDLAGILAGLQNKVVDLETVQDLVMPQIQAQERSGDSAIGSRHCAKVLPVKG